MSKPILYGPERFSLYPWSVLGDDDELVKHERGILMIDREFEATLTPDRFAVLMQNELERNAHKGDWGEWRPSERKIINELQYHLDKLVAAIFAQDPAKVNEHAGDLGNFAMKAVERFGVKQ